MRKRFEQGTELDAIQIPAVEIDSKCRHQLPQLLAGLQYIFVTPNVSEEIFSILENKILKGKKNTGRLGMTLWEIFVIGIIRLNMNLDYDMLQDMINNHETVRGILGVQTRKVFGESKYYELQTIKDNVSMLDEEVLKQINLVVVVKGGHVLKKKRRKKVK